MKKIPEIEVNESVKNEVFRNSPLNRPFEYRKELEFNMNKFYGRHSRSKSLPFSIGMTKESQEIVNDHKNTIIISGNQNNQLKSSPHSNDKKSDEAGKKEAGMSKELGELNKKKIDWRTLQQHYYPEGGWGWVITICALISHLLSHGTQLLIANILIQRYREGWLGGASVTISLLFSPIWVSLCKRKSTRLAAVFGGLLASLGCLFTSFSTQYHQLFISYGIFMGVGVGLSRDGSSLMVGQYFKRKREIVEILIVSASGLGIIFMSFSIYGAISLMGWRIGLQTITVLLLITFFLGTCYRSASLYHPQRRAILHLKNQKRKIKEKEKKDDGPPFVDFSSLKSKTLQIILLSCSCTAFGIYTPLFYLTLEYKSESKGRNPEFFSLVSLYFSLGIFWVLGCSLFGLNIIQKNQDCRVSKQYLCQISGLICGITILSYTLVEGFKGLFIFYSIYGFFLGGYNYALKVYTYERVRARHFPRAWSFIQSSQSIPLFFGIPITGYLNEILHSRAGYIFSALSVLLGSGFLFLTDVRRRRLSRRKAQNSSMKTCETVESTQSPKGRRLSFAFSNEEMSPHSKNEEKAQTQLDPSALYATNKELTCISEEGIADLDFQDIYFDEWADYFGADITSCNKVENCLVSEIDPEFPLLVERRARRYSNAHPNLATATAGVASGIAGLSNLGLHYNLITKLAPNVPTSSSVVSEGGSSSSRISCREIPIYNSNRNNRRTSRVLKNSIIETVIDEAEASV